MASKPLPSQEVLRQLLRYEPETGKLFWLHRSAGQTACTDPRGPAWAANHWNSRNAGKEAFTYADPRGYRHGKVDGVLYQAHRIIWKWVHGIDPDTIDHINGDVGNNRLDNLRDCSVAENSRNYAKPTDGTSIYRGVCWVERDQKWAARISAGASGKRSLGNYASEVDAAAAYDKAAIELHGQFATLNFPALSSLQPKE